MTEARKDKLVVSETSTQLAVKSLLVNINEDSVPRFDFTGTWTGRDVEKVTRLFRRAYTRHNRDIRRVLNLKEES